MARRLTGFRGDTASADGAALLAMAQRAAGALVAATSRAATAERAAEEAKEAVDQMCVDRRTRAERDAARRSTANGRPSREGRRARLRSLRSRRRETSSAHRATIAAETGDRLRRGARGGEVEAAEVWDEQKSQLGDVIRAPGESDVRRGKRERGAEPSACAAVRSAPDARRARTNEPSLGKSRKSRFARFDDSARRSIGTTYS